MNLICNKIYAELTYSAAKFSVVKICDGNFSYQNYTVEISRVKNLCDEFGRNRAVLRRRSAGKNGAGLITSATLAGSQVVFQNFIDAA